tara:strand:+ start:1626 stop:1970 length:345 start_codon:yes stop_codon:yes gene_type:complete
MIYGSLISGVILILIEFIAKNNPDLIAGYNALSQEEKDKIDTDKLTSITQKYMMLTGLSVVCVGPVLSLLNVDEKIHLYIIISLIAIGTTTLIIQSNRLKPKNKKKDSLNTPHV